MGGTYREHRTKYKSLLNCTHEEKDDHVVFDIIGIDAPLANALRRIMLSEVPTMAIENVYIYQNTSIMQDEVLAHRLGLIPIAAEPRMFSYVNEAKDKEMNETNTLVFTLGQKIEAELLAEKGIGKEHAKWSPVCTASYRLLPEIEIKKEFRGAEAEALVKLCPMKVFDIEDLGGNGAMKDKKAVVRYPRNCSMCRECIRRHPQEGEGQRIELRRVRDHFIFSVESVGVYKARDIVTEAMNVLKSKAAKLRGDLKNIYN
eukprot:jgi/Bigna1/57647/fgenesh1_pm.23_\